jgi:hypothetical protein
LTWRRRRRTIHLTWSRSIVCAMSHIKRFFINLIAVSSVLFASAQVIAQEGTNSSDFVDLLLPDDSGGYAMRLGQASPYVASEIASVGGCPSGYRSGGTINGTLYCVNSSVPQSCKAFTYGCGPNAAQCCGLNESNPCMPGYSTFKHPQDSWGAGAKACCIRP